MQLDGFVFRMALGIKAQTYGKKAQNWDFRDPGPDLASFLVTRGTLEVHRHYLGTSVLLWGSVPWHSRSSLSFPHRWRRRLPTSESEHEDD